MKFMDDDDDDELKYKN